MNDFTNDFVSICMRGNVLRLCVYMYTVSSKHTNVTGSRDLLNLVVFL